MTAPTTRFTLAGTAHLAWLPGDVGSGIASSAVRWQRAPTTGRNYPASWQHTISRAATIVTARGYTYCFSARARDHAGNTSAWSAARCTTVPSDDRVLTPSGG
jgi:hypothetical protein